jgi:hypothetical protein
MYLTAVARGCAYALVVPLTSSVHCALMRLAGLPRNRALALGISTDKNIIGGGKNHTVNDSPIHGSHDALSNKLARQLVG